MIILRKNFSSGEKEEDKDVVDYVIDPVDGTIKVIKNLGLESRGIDLTDDYIQIIKKLKEEK